MSTIEEKLGPVVIPPEQTGGVPVKCWTKDIDPETGKPVLNLEQDAIRQASEAARLPCVYRHVALMPDAHTGFGVPVGCVLPLHNAVSPNAVGVDIGCFTGDTKVSLLDGKEYSLFELTSRKEPFAVYSCKTDGTIQVSWAKALKTRDKAEIVEVFIDSGLSVKCTLDHEFMLRDGSYKKAKDLQAGDSLMPLRKYITKEGYVSVWQNKTENWQVAHWIAARSGILGKIPSFIKTSQKTIIHHKDFDGTNNDPLNLEFMGHKDHVTYHRSLVERNTHWQSPEFEQARTKALADKAQTPEGYEYFATRGTKNILAYMQSHRDEWLDSVKNNGIHGGKVLSQYNRSEKGRSKSREIARRIYRCPFCLASGRSGFFSANHRKVCKPFAEMKNHKVTKVVLLDEKQDVYCLQVPGNNFALSIGIFVHNCGMCAWNSGIKVADLDIKKLMTTIAADIPVGEGKNRSRSDLWLGHNRIVDHITDVEKKVDAAKALCKTLDYPDWSKAKIQIGTLGGGNHFIELQQDAEGNAWFMLHSGSRGLGAQLAKKFHHLAVKTCKKYYTRLPNEELAFLPADSDEGQWYIASLLAAQDFALANRLLMMICCQEALREQHHQTNPLKDIINIHHNYATIEHHHGENVWVHRKGATLARKTTVGIIPGSMCSKSYIVKGKENSDSFNSCSHGAGRPFSRTEARKRIAAGIDLPQHQQLGKVELFGSEDVHDELGSAYKSIDVVMNNQKDLVDIQIELLPVAVLKG